MVRALIASEEAEAAFCGSLANNLGHGHYGPDLAADFLLSARKEAVKAAFSQSAVLGDARYAGPFELVTPENFPKNRNDILTLCDRSSLQLFPVG